MAPRPALPVSLLLLLAAACHPVTRLEAEEVAIAVGDVLASVDEASQGGGFAALWLRRPRAFEPAWHERWRALALGTAEAHATCAGLPFSACAEGRRSRTLEGCYLGWGYLEGEVSLRFDDAACGLASEGQGVTRTADIRLRGPRAGTLRLDADGGGVRLLRRAGGFEVTVPGLRRTQVDDAGATVLDVRTTTAAPLALAGEGRAGRVLSLDGLVVEDVRGGLRWTVDAGAKLAWDAECNCASSGVLGARASGERSARLRLELVGCGKGLLSVDGGKAEEVILDRCGTL
ncbi:MAG: hypothetical protein RL653_1122 [Pseudomonadota bacterium]